VRITTGLPLTPAMMIPVTHENMRGRRWPWVTTIIIGLNVLIFLLTIGPLTGEFRQMSQISLHLVLLSAKYPHAHLTPDAAALVADFQRQYPVAYKELSGPRQMVFDQFDVELQRGEWTDTDIEAEATRLGAALTQFEHDSFAWTYAYHSYRPTVISFLSWNFLHGGWSHILFNMWFLWLAGAILEDTWGRIAYPVFYMICGIAAVVVQGAVFPESFRLCVGASGAIAGLMGAFLARFPATKIKMLWLWGFVGKLRSLKVMPDARLHADQDERPRWIRPYYLVPAYVLLPLWLVIQVFWGALATTGVDGGIAYWAHIGGFAFGMLGAVILRTTGLEKAADQAIEAKVSWTADPHIVRATEHMGTGDFDGAVTEMQQLIKEQPDSIEAHELLLKAQDKKQDNDGQKQTLAALCRVHIAAGNGETAWGYYEQFQNLGGEKLPRGVWLALCRYLESAHAYETAVSEYKRFAEVNASERASVSALISAAGICLTHLRKREEAEALYRAAEASPVDHLDLQGIIDEGLKQCSSAAPKLGTYTAR
jgi:membrane associated rhomboid family serine protease